MNIYSIKQYIIQNPEYIEKILEDAGFYKIVHRANEIRCAYDKDSNPTSIKINKDTLNSFDFGRGINGDIITLVQHKVGCNFRKALKLICKSANINKSITTKEEVVKLPFGGFFKKVGKYKENSIEMNYISERILKDFATVPNKMFLKDGINIESCELYEIGYDVITGMISVPWRDTLGRLVGIMGRHNQSNIKKDIPKWSPIIPFPKSKVIYGYDKNYGNIRENGIIVVGESEKFCMQLHSMGLSNGLAVGGSYISASQARAIQSLMPKMVILGFDEGLEEEHIIDQAKKIKLDNPFLNIDVGYLYDDSGLYLPKGSKASPSDFDKKTLEGLMKNCLKIL